MDEAWFWRIVEDSRTADEDETLQRLQAALQALEPETLAGFQRCYDRLHHRADRGDLWAAALLLNGGFCSDDGFTDFRAWLIAQGRAVYERALEVPDSLAVLDLPCDEDGPRARFESFGYAAAEAWEHCCDGDLHDWMRESRAAEVRAPPAGPSWDWQDYTDAVLAQRLPELWRRYGRFKQAADAADVGNDASPKDCDDFPNATLVEGLGAVRRDVAIEHRTYGAGIVLEVTPMPAGALVHIRFGDRERWMLVDASSGLWRLP